MAKSAPLGAGRVVAFVAISSAERAKAFYRDKLGLRLVGEDGFAVVFDAHGTTLRATLVGEVVVAPYTVLGWAVPDIVAAAKALSEVGIEFLRFGGMAQDELGVWTAPGGAKVAWFKDPDGHTLSISEH
jgi:catechol 2,3-dioxygenase-like lactoylglutathione lyase family enzyme